MPGRHETHSLSAVAAAVCGEALAFGTPAIVIVFGIVDARFIEIYPLVGLVLR